MILQFPIKRRKIRQLKSTPAGQGFRNPDLVLHSAGLTAGVRKLSEEMSIKLTTAVWQLEIPLSEKMVLLALAGHVNDKDITKPCWPGIPLLSKECRISERQVQRNLKSLERQSLIRREFRKDQSTYYHVLVTPMSPHAPEVVTPASPAPVTRVTTSGDTHVTQNLNLNRQRTLAVMPAKKSEEDKRIDPETQRLLDELVGSLRTV